MQVSINWLSENMEMHGATVRKRIASLERDKKGRVNLRAAAEAMFGVKTGSNGNGQFIPTPEANRQLIISKKQEIDLDMEIKRGSRIPIEDCLAVDNEILQAIAGSLKANRNKPLTEELINELFGNMREWSQRFEAAA